MRRTFSSLTFAVGCFVLIAGCGPADVVPAPDADSGDDTRKTELVQADRKPAESADAMALAAVERLIDAKRTDAHRAAYSVDVPKAPTGLPSSYKITLWGGYGELGMLHIDVTVDANGASAELISREGIMRGVVSADEIDKYSRMALYLSSAGEQYRPANVGAGAASAGGSHAPYYTVEFSAADSPLFQPVISSEGQSVVHEIEPNLLKQYSHTWITDTLEKVVRNNLEQAEVTPELIQEVLQRFQGRRESVVGMKVGSPKTELEIEVHLDAHLLAKWKCSGAIEPLRAMGFVEHSGRLAVMASGGSEQVLKASVIDPQRGVAVWTLDYMRDEVAAGLRRDVLLYALKRVQKKHFTMKLLDDLSELEATPEAIASAVRVFENAGHDLEVRIAAANVLLGWTHEARFYKFLIDQVRMPSSNVDELPDPTMRAIGALGKYAATYADKGGPAADTLRRRLAETPRDSHSTFGGMDTLIPLLGEIGRIEDAEELKTWADHPSFRISALAVEAVNRSDAAWAIAESRRRIRLYVDRNDPFDASTEYGWATRLYAEILVANLAKETLPDLEKLQHWLNKQQGRRVGGEITYLQELLAILKSDVPSRQAQLAVSFVENHYLDYSLRLRLAGKLAETGVEKGDLAPLTRPRKKRPRIRVGY
jgi:hypothetical protein